MKKILICMLLGFTALSAQTLLNQGTFGIGTNASYYHIQTESNAATTSLKILPGLDYFVFQNFSIGVASSFTLENEENPWQFGPNMRFYINALYHFKPFLGANYMASASKEHVNGCLGAVFFLTKHVALETVAQYNQTIGESSVQRVIFAGGLRLFL